MEERWVVAAKRADFGGIGERLHLDPVVVRLIRNRDVFTERDDPETTDDKIRKYLDGGLSDLYDPSRMKDIDKGSRVIFDAIRGKQKIRIIGDYDIDGIMSSCILLKGFRKLGADVSVKIPDRIRNGYGLNENLVREANDDGVNLIVTCDNGIAASEQIRLAQELGMRAVVTDHHAIPFRETEQGEKEYLLPPAEAVINPHRADDSYPFDGLCGAGVAFKLICYMYDRADLPDREREKEKLLEFAAIATVGDVMDLIDENRILVREGLKRLHRTTNPGLCALAEQCGIEKSEISTYHIGFVLGPCLNASGRLDTAERALRMLLTNDPKEAGDLAADLVSLNVSRKDMTAEGLGQALDRVENSDLKKDKVLVVYLPECHQSLAGIIAGRLREHYYRPSFVLTGKNEVKGSGRSIEGYSMYDELCKIRDVFTTFGGHPMAAGVSLLEEKVEEFRRRINEVCTLTPEELTPKTVIDVAMPVSYIREDLLHQMRLLEPCGKGNTRPVFAQSGMRIQSPRVFGKNRNVCKMILADRNGHRMDAVFFGDADEFVRRTSGCEISVTYYPEIDTWQGRNRLQVRILSYR
ncbi:MAG: single-stranded-DNA-specific exonuclease RecJ [Lachnospiraceae bacterium]|nr:single-stranded-DNA-specific exonuclease RecJ [Lachnospiraceae bacterium]